MFPGNTALEVIGNDRTARSSISAAHLDVGAEPIAGALAERGLREGVVGKSEHGDEDLSRSATSCVPILDRHRLISIIDK